MIGAALIAAAFTFTTIKDPFTDALSFYAQIGQDRGPMLAFECGAETEGQMEVLVKSARSMYRPDYILLSRYPERVRFDSQPAETFKFQYDGEYALLSGDEAKRFTVKAKAAATVFVEVEEYDGKKADLQIPLAGAADSIARVEQACRV